MDDKKIKIDEELIEDKKNNNETLEEKSRKTESKFFNKLEEVNKDNEGRLK